MIQSIDLSGTQQASSDHELLRACLQQVVNQPFLHFRFSYGDELSLHFGSPRQYASQRLKHLSKGSYIIAVRASNWFLGVANPPSIIVGAADLSTNGSSTPVSKQQLETSTFVTQVARILAVDTVLYSSGPHSRSAFALTLLLSDGASLFIRPDLDDPADESDDESDDIADWEIFTPHERCIKVGPGLQWAYVNTRRAPGSRTPT